MEMRAALAHEDIAREHELTVRALRPETLDSLSRPLRDEPTPFLCANSCRFI
jgi:hypothetical protein